MRSRRVKNLLVDNFRLIKILKIRQTSAMDLVRGFKLVAIVTISAVLLSGCGKSSVTYASDAKDGVFFSVPNSWSSVTPKSLAAQESLSTAQGAAERLALVHFQIAYSPNVKIAARDVLSLTAPTSPIVYARVRELTDSEIQQVSYNDLRNLILPLSTWEDGTASSIPVYSVASDQEAVQKGGRGIHTVFSFTNNGVSQTINQTGLLSNDHRTLVMFVVRCSTVCYTKNKAAIEKAVASLTDRGPR